MHTVALIKMTVKPWKHVTERRFALHKICFKSNCACQYLRIDSEKSDLVVLREKRVFRSIFRQKKDDIR